MGRKQEVATTNLVEMSLGSMQLSFSFLQMRIYCMFFLILPYIFRKDTSYSMSWPRHYIQVLFFLLVQFGLVCLISHHRIDSNSCCRSPTLLICLQFTNLKFSHFHLCLTLWPIYSRRLNPMMKENNTLLWVLLGFCWI